jgi:O-antigen/teichoic acid export membrane protein
LKVAKSNKLLLLNISGSFLIKGLAALIQLALLPAYMRFFSDQAILGIWFTIIGFIGFILSFDIGIGNGLRNNLTVSIAQNDKETAKKYISSAYISLGIFTIIIALLGFIIANTLDWSTIFNISNDVLNQDILSEAVKIVFLGIVLKLFFHLISSVFYAIQIPMINNLIAVLQSLSLLVFLYIAKPGNPEQSIIMLAWANVICINLPDLIATIIAFSTKLRDIRPNVLFFKKEYAKNILNLGLLIFITQIFGLFISQIDIFITNIFSSVDVVEFQIYNRVFLFFTLLFILAMAPLWSAVTKAIAQNRYIWVLKLYKLVFLLAIIISMLLFAIIPMLGFIFNFWLGENAPIVQFDYALVSAFYGAISIFCSAWGVLSHGMGIVKPYLITRGIAVLLKLPLTYLLSSIFMNWSAVVLVIFLIMLPEAIVTPVIIYKNLKRKENESKNV